jgi:hypothetical protein
MILDRALQLVLHSACILGAHGGRAVRLPPVRKRVAWSPSVDSASQPVQLLLAEQFTEIKNGKRHRIARSCRCRAAAQIYAAMTLYSEPTNERIIVSLMGHLREGCDD